MKQALKIDKNLDKHLKVLKSKDDELSSLELATEGNGARISGDLEVTGDTDNIKHRSEAIVKADGNVTLDSAGDITLNATGADINFAAGGTSYLNWDATGVLTMKSVADTDDLLKILVGSNGVSSISTNDDTGGNLADLTLKPEGDLIFNPMNGIYIAKNNNTEFSAANSAYAGMILGYTALAIDAGDASYTTTTSMAVPHASLQVTFVAPPSGKVEISVSIFVDTVAGRNLIFGLSDNSTYSAIDFPNADDVTNEHYVYKGDETDEEDVTHQWVVEGLTAGTSYTWYFGAMSAVTSGAYILRWGGNAVGEYAPFIMKATALPSTIYTG